MLLT
ncbi:putative lipoprotein, partial [Vibrio parahaemolyticus VPTS-2010]|jgi:hypothetical protein